MDFEALILRERRSGCSVVTRRTCFGGITLMFREMLASRFKERENRLLV